MTAIIMFTSAAPVYAADQVSGSIEPAQPGFFGHPSSHSGYLGFRSSAYLSEPGIWGALLLTAEQGNSLAQAFAETWARRIDDSSIDGETKKHLEQEFNRRRGEILTEEQNDILREVNRIYRELEDRQKAEGWKRIETPVDQLKLILPPANYINLEGTLDQKP